MTNRSHTTRLPPFPCPHCGTVHDAASDARQKAPPPKPGDLTLCIACAGVAQFTNDMKLRVMSQDEWDAYCAEHPQVLVEIRRHQQAIRRAQRR